MIITQEKEKNQQYDSNVYAVETLSSCVFVSNVSTTRLSVVETICSSGSSCTEVKIRIENVTSTFLDADTNIYFKKSYFISHIARNSLLEFLKTVDNKDN